MRKKLTLLICCYYSKLTLKNKRREYMILGSTNVGVAKRAEPIGPTRLARYFGRAGLRYSARDPKLARPV
jgi:hypothetical protein